MSKSITLADIPALSDKDLVDLCRDRDASPVLVDAAWKEGATRIEKARRKKHPANCLCADCQNPEVK
jgi:hypothetical protein